MRNQCNQWKKLCKLMSISDEQEQICRDLVQALSTPRPVSRSHELLSPETSLNSNDALAKEGLFQSLLTRLRALLPQ